MPSATLTRPPPRRAPGRYLCDLWRSLHAAARRCPLLLAPLPPRHLPWAPGRRVVTAFPAPARAAHSGTVYTPHLPLTPRNAPVYLPALCSICEEFGGAASLVTPLVACKRP